MGSSSVSPSAALKVHGSPLVIRKSEETEELEEKRKKRKKKTYPAFLKGYGWGGAYDSDGDSSDGGAGEGGGDGK